MAKTRAIFKCSDEFKEKFSTSDCLLSISVGQAIHEGEAFEATMDLINKSFAACTILVDNSLQRHNMVLSSDKDADFFY